MKDCINYGRGKTRKKKIPKEERDKRDGAGERIGLDTTGCKVVSLRGNKFAAVPIDHGTELHGGISKHVSGNMMTILVKNSNKLC